MGFFHRRHQQPAGRQSLPPDIVARLARYARFEISPHAGGDYFAEQGSLLADISAFALAEPERFLTDLESVARDSDGWAAYGASCVAWEMVGSQHSYTPTYQTILDKGIAFLRANGVPPMRVKGYEWQRWLETGGDNTTWLPLRPIPTLAEAPITPLQAGETRKVMQMAPSPDANLIFVCQLADGRYCAIIDARASDEDPRRVRNEWKYATTLHDLYADIATSLQTPPDAWYDPEIEPYFPLTRPTI